jgi:hypothetical protein
MFVDAAGLEPQTCSEQFVAVQLERLWWEGNSWLGGEMTEHHVKVAH